MVRWHPSPAVAPLLAGIAAFAYVYLATGAIENDHFIMLARAHQVVYGDWPVRDFEDPGMPLAYLVSAAAAALFGPTLLVNVIASILFFAVTAAFTYLLTRRLSGSTIAAIAAAAVTIALYPRLYNTTKVVVPVIAMVLAWRYTPASPIRHVAGMAFWTAIAFLLRHDYAVYVVLLNVVLLALTHAQDPREAARRITLYAVFALLFSAPWLIYVQRNEGVGEYFDAALRFVGDEGRRTAGGGPQPLFYAAVAIPVAGVVVCWRRRASRMLAPLAGSAVMLLAMDAVFLRDVTAVRLPDVVAPTAIVASAIAGLTMTRRAIDAASMVLAVVLLVVGIAVARPARAIVRAGALPERAARVTARLRHAAPEIQPVPARAPLIAYLARCTRSGDRILVGGFAPEIPVLAHRPLPTTLYSIDESLIYPGG